MEYVMGIDLGTSSVKAVVMDQKGRIAAWAGQSYDVIIPEPGYAIQNPEHWWQKTRCTIQDVIRKARIPADSVKAIGFSGQMHGLVALDAQGRPVIPAIIWMDQRSKQERHDIEDLVLKLGLQEELMNRPCAGMLLCSLLWVKRHQPEIYQRIAHVLLPKDYIRYRMGKTIETDETDGAGTIAFSVKTRTWCTKLLQALDIAPDLFPPVVKSCQITGFLSPDAALETGLAPGTLLAAGGADSAMQLTGNGVITQEALACNIGTASQILTVTSSPVYDRKLRTQTFCHSMDGMWYLQCGSLNGGSALNWFKNQVLKTEKPYDRLAAEAAKVPAGSGGLLFLPYLAGERIPYENPDARGMFFGLSLDHDQASLVRSVMEGVSLNLRLCQDIFTDMGMKKEYLITSGGGAGQTVWKQILADVFNLPVYASKTVQEACTGAAMMACVALGWDSSVKDSAQRIARIGREPLLPAAEHVKCYEEMRWKFMALYEKIRDMY